MLQCPTLHKLLHITLHPRPVNVPLQINQIYSHQSDQQLWMYVPLLIAVISSLQPNTNVVEQI